MTGAPGIGAMLHYLKGGSEKDPTTFVGRIICGASLADDRLTLTLDGGEKIAIWDNAQSCCETRYMRTDDDLSVLLGHRITTITTKDAPDVDGGGEVHECVFVEVATDGGFVTLSNHNEHNGYYGGFGLTITAA